MPDAVIVIVGGAAGAGVVGVAGAVVTGGVGVVGVDDVDPPEQALINRTASKRKMRSTALVSPAAQPDWRSVSLVNVSGTLTWQFAAVSATYAGSATKWRSGVTDVIRIG